MNHSFVTESPSDSYLMSTLISNELKLIIGIVNYVLLCNLICVFGMVSNVINVVVFYKQGLDSSINITFFALAISDLCGIIFQILFNVYLNPFFNISVIPFVPEEFQYLQAGLPRVTFSRITGLITVYATMERCLCITFPLHIKQMITPRKTAIVMIAIYGLTFMSLAPVYCTASLGWKFYSNRNRTLIGLIISENSHKLQETVYTIQASIGLGSVVAVVIFTTILIRKLGEKSTWRQAANADQAKSESMSNRDRRTISMVVLIASILILCYTPSVMLYLVTFFEPDFNIAGRYEDMFLFMWSFGTMFETINSSVNILLYFKMSSNYRDILRSLCQVQVVKCS